MIAYRRQTCIVFDEFDKPSRRCFRNKSGKRINKSQRDKRFKKLKSLLLNLEAVVKDNAALFTQYSISVEDIKTALEEVENTIDKL